LHPLPSMEGFRRFWASLRSSLWFVPSLMVLGAIGLAIGLIELSTLIGADTLQERWPRLFGASEEGSRELLGAVAMSTITVTGVVFSVTVLTLAQAASQYSPRLLRNFMARRQVQLVLGTFAGIYTYALVVLRTIRSGGEDNDATFYPLAVFGGLALALIGIGVLIFFIHHIAASLDASSIVSSVSQETRSAIDNLFPEELGRGVENASEQGLPIAKWTPIPAAATGYLQIVENDQLLEFAAKRNVLVRMDRGIGEFVVEGTPLLSLADTEEPDDETVRCVNALFVINSFRTVEQDPSFGIREIVDIALKGLSPSINDETTAITCIDHLAALLSRLATRRIEPRLRADDEKVRVIARGPTFESLVNESFDQIRHEARGKVTVLLRLLWCLETVARQTEDRSRRRVLATHLRLMLDEVARFDQPRERHLLEQQVGRVMAALTLERSELVKVDTRVTPQAF
jgi:uncharacterized membrane protein